MRLDRLAGIALIVIGSLALLGRSTGAGFNGQVESRLLDERREQIEAGSLNRLVLDVEAGSLSIVGDRRASSVSLRAEFHGPDEGALAKLELSHAVEADSILVRTRTGNSRGRIDLELHIPAGLALQVEDGSGSIRIESTDGGLSIDDGSGSIQVRDLGGDLRVQDGSGSLSVSGVGGDVMVTDGSGSIQVEGVGGDVTIRDGSGSIRVRDVDGRFHLAADGSGSVSTSRIRGGVS